MAFENTGRVWTVRSLKSHLDRLAVPAWCNAVTLHHTAAPSLLQRPDGLTAQHLKNIEHYYRVIKGWSSAPHLFVDDRQLWGMCDFRKKGVHAVSFNGRSIGIEVLGNYDVEEPASGRGFASWQNAAGAARAILDWLGRTPGPDTVLFHRDDPRTSKTCPGKKVGKDWVLDLIDKATEQAVAGTSDPAEKPVASVPLPPGELRFDGVKWTVPVGAFLRLKGIGEQELRQNLKRRGKYFYYKEELLEDAYFDAATEATWASLSELEGLRLTDG